MAKLRSVRTNAEAVLNMQKHGESFSEFLWRYVEFNPVINNWETEGQIPVQTPLSVQLSKDLKKFGFKFVGPVTTYSFMQAIGMVDDHINTCACHTLNR